LTGTTVFLGERQLDNVRCAVAMRCSCNASMPSWTPEFLLEAGACVCCYFTFTLAKALYLLGFID
jgi:hypothetical protein